MGAGTPSHAAGRLSAPSWRWIAVAALATLVASASARYLVGGAAMVPPELKTNFAGHRLAFYIHIAAASTALLLGPWQFLGRLRRARPAVHRAMGRLYVAACLVGALAAFPIAVHSNGGPVAAAGFMTLATAWLWTTARAVFAVFAGDVERHRRWMIRSFSLALAGVTLRLYLPVALMGFAPFSVVYAGIAWVCWVPNLIVADRLARATQTRRAPSPNSEASTSAN